MICEGYSKEDLGSKKHADKLEPSGGGSSGTPSPPETSSTPSRFKSDHIVSRMRLFFQGSSATKEPRSHSPQPQRRWKKAASSFWKEQAFYCCYQQWHTKVEWVGAFHENCIFYYIFHCVFRQTFLLFLANSSKESVPKFAMFEMIHYCQEDLVVIGPSTI